LESKKVEKKNTMAIILILLILNQLSITFNHVFAFSVSNALTIIVPRDYPTIQGAVNAARPGSTIYVKAGTYYEKIFINKTILLFGESRSTTIIKSGGDMDTIRITANNGSISGFTIENEKNYTHSYGIKMSNTCNNVVSNNIITRNFVGVKIEDGSCNNIIKDNIITRNRYGVFICLKSNNNIVCNNVVSESDWNGIELNFCERNIVYGNTIVNNTAYGLEIPIYAPSCHNIIFHNNFLSNKFRNAYGPNPNFWASNCEGNYWDDYNGTDINEDGIGDAPYYMLSQSELEIPMDSYPLMGKFTEYQILCERNLHNIEIISNSTVSSLHFENIRNKRKIAFYVDGVSIGFCRIKIPNNVLDNFYDVAIDCLKLLSVKELVKNANYIILYFTYPTGPHLISIYNNSLETYEPFSALILLLTLMMLTTLSLEFLLLFFCCSYLWKVIVRWKRQSFFKRKQLNAYVFESYKWYC